MSKSRLTHNYEKEITGIILTNKVIWVSYSMKKYVWLSACLLEVTAALRYACRRVCLSFDTENRRTEFPLVILYLVLDLVLSSYLYLQSQKQWNLYLYRKQSTFFIFYLVVVHSCILNLAYTRCVMFVVMVYLFCERWTITTRQSHGRPKWPCV